MKPRALAAEDQVTHRAKLVTRGRAWTSERVASTQGTDTRAHLALNLTLDMGTVRKMLSTIWQYAAPVPHCSTLV